MFVKLHGFSTGEGGLKLVQSIDLIAFSYYRALPVPFRKIDWESAFQGAVEGKLIPLSRYAKVIDANRFKGACNWPI